MLQKTPYLNFSIALSPAGHLHLVTDNNVQVTLDESSVQEIQKRWQNGYASGLLHLGLITLSTALPPSFMFWRQFAQKFITEVCKYPDFLVTPTKTVPVPDEEELNIILNQAPFMQGGEYLNLEVLYSLWTDLNLVLRQELSNFNNNLQQYFEAYHAHWNLVGRVCFHLAENKENQEMPFAFLATYTTRLTNNAQVQHLPLGKALQEYAGDKNKALLLALLLPVQKACEASPFIKDLVSSGRIFKPLAWKPQEAYRFLKEIHLFESAGIVVRVPNWWNAKKPSRPKVEIKIGKNPAHNVGADALLDFDVQLALADGQTLSTEEWQEILVAADNLIKIKGQWVEVDKEKLAAVLQHWQTVQHDVAAGDLSFAEGMRLLAGFSKTGVSEEENLAVAEWSSITAIGELKQILASMRHPKVDGNSDELLAILQKHLHAKLRPYQIAGVQWLLLLYNLKLGGCLADDMGLGKTIQVLALLLIIKKQQKKDFSPHLIVVPASLLGNWQAEIARFAPSLKIFIAHPSEHSDVKQINSEELADFDIVFTTYTFVQRLGWLIKIPWGLVILDEAQAIKNPSAKQTRAVKNIASKTRIILTGTPIENNLGDLWSLFDFIAPGLLGAQKTFSDYGKKLQHKVEANFFGSLRTLVSPYILRRLKNDKSIINDLPDKTELNAYCTLSRQQISLYQQAVMQLAKQLEVMEGMERRGLVLASLMRLKQICNHPCQWLGHGDYVAEESGKFLRLQELCTAIAAKQEKVLIFTQFREIIPALSVYLATIFQKNGLVLHGGTKIKERAELVRLFQDEKGPPFFILSLKAGGTGLNLTNAAHVIHFDRWWNPAVENQATDRAYRIGQKKNVLVHKFICSGTIEEKIDLLINDKKALSQEILSGGGEVSLTEMTNEELLQTVSLDLDKIIKIP
ncbi:MAG: hypothetical protein A2X78_03285 [Gammaproteobacteria bacterium GWE2_37_16]|nr:MAG: hypothetical protein A2X78_03285 [Gammaproteobacteria bacterium GWE2_37_16]